MEEKQLIFWLNNYLGVQLNYDSVSELHLAALPSKTIGLSICSSGPGLESHLKSFEIGMRRLLDARAGDLKFDLFLAVAVDDITEKRKPSYRKALKKYSNAIVFEDLRIGVLLVGKSQIIEILPHEANDYLRNLDKNILKA